MRILITWFFVCFSLAAVCQSDGQVQGGSFGSGATGGYFPPSGGGCEIPATTRTQLINQRNSSLLEKGCHYVVTDYSRGTIGSVQVMLHATDINELSQEALFSVSCDNSAWSGLYDIDRNRILEMRDNIGNVVIGDNSVDVFPWCVAAVEENYVFESTVNYVAGNFDDNKVVGNATVNVNGGNVYRNEFEAQSNTTINSGDFRENKIMSDATVSSSTSGDIDNNHFGNNSNSNISGVSNLDDSYILSDANLNQTGGNVVSTHILQEGNLTISGGSFADNTIGEDAEVTIVSGSNYENKFGTSTIYRQVGTGYIRYSTIEGTTTWINGNTNVSNVKSYVTSVNTTGSSGTISNSEFNRAYLVNCRNVSNFQITDCTVSDYSTIQVNNATRLYLLRTNLDSQSRVLQSAGTTFLSTGSKAHAYGYFQVLQGTFTANYCTASNYGYFQHNSPNSNLCSRSTAENQARIRFINTVSNCRIYYSKASTGSLIEHRGSSSGSYVYYSTALSSSQIYTNNSVNSRMYYNTASGAGIIYSQNCTSTHYIYYCVADARGYIIAINNSGSIRMYSINASSQSIARFQNTTVNSNWYYSNFDAYFYAYLTKTGGTSSGLFGIGRRTQTITQPVLVTPYSAGSAWLNF